MRAGERRKNRIAMRYGNEHLLSGQGSLTAPNGETTPVFYVVRTVDVAPGNSGPFSPVFEDVTVQEIICRKKPEFAAGHAREPLKLTMDDGSTIEVVWESDWTSSGAINRTGE